MEMVKNTYLMSNSKAERQVLNEKVRTELSSLIEIERIVSVGFIVKTKLTLLNS